MTRKDRLSRSGKILVSVAYAVAAVTNLAGLYASYTLAEALRTDILRMTIGSPLTDTRVILAQHSYLSQQMVAFFVHAAVGATILLVVWRANREPETKAG